MRHEKWYGETALIWAAAENHAPAVRLLVEGGAKVDLASKKMVFPRKVGGQTTLPVGAMTPLMYAAREGALDAARALVEAGANLNVQDPDGTTAMVLAIINGHYDVAAMLRREGRRSQRRRFDRHGRALRGGRHEHACRSCMDGPTRSPRVASACKTWSRCCWRTAPTSTSG